MKQLKKYIVFILLLLPITGQSAEVQFIAGNQTGATPVFSTSKDYALRLGTSGDVYGFIEGRRMTVTPYYGGENMDFLGLGVGKRIRFDKFNVFVEGGYYFTKIASANPENDENIEYYMAHRFGPVTPTFYGYAIESKDAPFAAIGIDLPITKNTFVTLSWMYLHVWTNFIAYVTPEKRYPELWHDPEYRDFSAIRVGFSLRM